MTTEKLNPGDVVRLRSGGPEMTIEEIAIYGYSANEKALCKWFEGAKLMESLFELSSLQKTGR